MLRALRVDKIHTAFLESICSYYLNDKDLNEKNLLYKTLMQNPKTLEKRGFSLQQMLLESGIETELQRSKGQFGGGALPGEEIESTALCLSFTLGSNKERSTQAERMHYNLLQHPDPLLSILKKGKVYFDMLTLVEEDMDGISRIISETYKKLMD